MIDLLSDHTELFKQFSDNPSFKKSLGDTIFGVTYQQQTEQPTMGARQQAGTAVHANTFEERGHP